MRLSAQRVLISVPRAARVLPPTSHLVTPHRRRPLPLPRTRLAAPCSMSSSSSAPAPMKEYLLILPDHANALDKRLAVRATHFENLTPCVDAGQVVLGGATLARHPAAGQPPEMNGSAVLIKAESEEQVWAWVKND